MNHFPQLTNEHYSLLLGILKEDLLERYDNMEYWDMDTISTFFLDNGYNCFDCGEPIPEATNRGAPVRCQECQSDDDLNRNLFV